MYYGLIYFDCKLFDFSFQFQFYKSCFAESLERNGRSCNSNGESKPNGLYDIAVRLPLLELLSER